MRLIDATAYRKELEGEKASPGNSNDVLMGLEIAIADLGDMPTIDAVPVVRCRECKYCDSTIFNGNFIGFCEIRKDSYGAKLRVGLSDYCSDGERKEGAD